MSCNFTEIYLTYTKEEITSISKAQLSNDQKVKLEVLYQTKKSGFAETKRWLSRPGGFLT